MKKLLFSLISLLWAVNAYGQTGFLTRTNCASIASPVANQTFCGQTTTAGGRTAGGMYVWSGSAWVPPSNLSGGGTVTSVGAVGTPNQITVSGSSPITSAGTFTFSIPTNPTLPGTTTGTFSGNLTGTASGNTTNGAPLTANLPVIGAGSNAIAVGTRTGDTTQYATSTGSHTSGNCAEWDANGNIVQSSGACGIAGAGYGTIQDEGSNLTARTTMNFVGAGVTAADDSGNSRTNITIPGGATLSQGTLAGRGGASGSGVYEEITLGSGLSMSGTTLSASGGLIEILSHTVTSDISDFVFTGLDGDTDGVYLLVYEIETISSTSGVFVRPNSVTTNLSDSRMFPGGSDTSASEWELYHNGGNAAILTGKMTIFASKAINSVARKRYATFEIMQDIAGSFVPILGAGIWNETSTNMTSLQVFTNQATGIKNGSRMTLYRYAQ